MAYQYDVFISYNSAHPRIKTWVEDHFIKLFRESCDDEWGDEEYLQYSIWSENSPGVVWPDAIRQAHAQSKMLLAIVTPSYFNQSKWCLAEWKVMREREQFLPNGSTDSLIYPVLWSDGIKIKKEQDPLNYADFTAYAHPEQGFCETPLFIKFRNEMRELVKEIEQRRNLAPPYQDPWPSQLDIDKLVCSATHQPHLGMAHD